MSTGISNDERILALFSTSPRLSFDEVKNISQMQRLALLQSISRLVDKGLLRREKVNHGRKNAAVYFELRK